MLSYFYGGEEEIRTLDTLRHTAFRERPDQPLLHLSMLLFILAENGKYCLNSARYRPKGLLRLLTKKCKHFFVALRYAEPCDFCLAKVSQVRILSGFIKKNRLTLWLVYFSWWTRQDSNLRPSAPQADALSSWATSPKRRTDTIFV